MQVPLQETGQRHRLAGCAVPCRSVRYPLYRNTLAEPARVAPHSNGEDDMTPPVASQQISENSPLAGLCLGSFKLPSDLAFAIAGGRGALVWDRDGNEYFDYVMGSGPMALGHAHPRIVEAICDQAAKGTHFYQLNEGALQLAEVVRRLVPCAESVKFCSDGSEATFYCLRLARAFTRRNIVLKFDGSFHGHHDYAKQRLQTGAGQNSIAVTADTAGIPPEVSTTVLIAPYNDLAATRAIIEPMADEIAAILVEPVQRSTLPESGFLEGLRALASEIGAMLVFDEVVSGFRLALGGAQEAFGVVPDLCALGKVLGGGTPLAAVAGRADVLELTDPHRSDDGRSVFMSGTLNGNPLGCAAGLATLAVLEEEDGPAKLAANGSYLRSELSRVADELSVPFVGMGVPAFQQFAFVAYGAGGSQSPCAINAPATNQFAIEMIKRNILVVPGGKIYTSLAHDAASQDAFVGAAKEAIRSVRDAGLLD